MFKSASNFRQGDRVYHVLKDSYGVVAYVRFEFIGVRSLDGGKYQVSKSPTLPAQFLRHATDEEFEAAEVLDA